MSDALGPNMFSDEFCQELARGVIRYEICESDWYKSLTPKQAAGFDDYAGPLMMREGLETGGAVERERAQNLYSSGLLIDEVSLFLKRAAEGERILDEQYGDKE